MQGRGRAEAGPSRGHDLIGRNKGGELLRCDGHVASPMCAVRPKGRLDFRKNTPSYDMALQNRNGRQNNSTTQCNEGVYKPYPSNKTLICLKLGENERRKYREATFTDA